MPNPEPSDAAEVVRLWPDGPPTPIDCVSEEVAYSGPAGVAVDTVMLRNISDPTLSVMTPPDGSGNGVGVIVAPGGGWTISAWTHEGLDVVRWLTGRGYTVFLLKYRVQDSGADQAAFEERMAQANSLHTGNIPFKNLPGAIGDVMNSEAYFAARAAAAEDGRRAIEIARELASKYALRDGALGMLGFSAGAFLAVDVALDPRAEQLAFIAPIYGGETCGLPVPADAPPLFTAVARDDILYKIVDGVHREWVDADRPSEMHVFGRGQHGFGMVKQGMPSDAWTDLFLAWVEDLFA